MPNAPSSLLPLRRRGFLCGVGASLALPLATRFLRAAQVASQSITFLATADLVDDMSNPENWNRYKSFYDPRGKARLRLPAYEGIGNHDLSVRQAFGELNPLQREFIERNKQRRGDFVFSADHYHYAWQWGGVRTLARRDWVR